MRNSRYQIFNTDLTSAAKIDGSALVETLGGKENPNGSVFDIQNSRVGEPSPYTVIVRSPRRTASTHFLINAGMT